MPEIKKRMIYRDSITGRFVTKEYAEENPYTTQGQTVIIPEKEDKEDETQLP